MWLVVANGSDYPGAMIAPEPIYRRVARPESALAAPNPAYLWKSAVDGKWHVNRWIGPQLTMSGAYSGRLYLLPVPDRQVWGAPISSGNELWPMLVQTDNGFIYMSTAFGVYEDCLPALESPPFQSPDTYGSYKPPDVSYTPPAGWTWDGTLVTKWWVDSRGMEFYRRAGGVAGSYTRYNYSDGVTRTLTAVLEHEYPHAGTSGNTYVSSTLTGSYGSGLVVGWKRYASSLGGYFHEVYDSSATLVYPATDESLYIWYNNADDRYYCSATPGVADPLLGYWMRNGPDILDLYEYYHDPSIPELGGFTLSDATRADNTLLPALKKQPIRLSQADIIFNRAGWSEDASDITNLIRQFSEAAGSTQKLAWFEYLLDRLSLVRRQFMRMLQAPLPDLTSVIGKLYPAIALATVQYVKLPFTFVLGAAKKWTVPEAMAAVAPYPSTNFYGPTAVHPSVPLDVASFKAELVEPAKLGVVLTTVRSGDAINATRGWGNPVRIRSFPKMHYGWSFTLQWQYFSLITPEGYSSLLTGSSQRHTSSFDTYLDAYPVDIVPSVSKAGATWDPGAVAGNILSPPVTPQHSENSGGMFGGVSLANESRSSLCYSLHMEPGPGPGGSEGYYYHEAMRWRAGLYWPGDPYYYDPYPTYGYRQPFPPWQWVEDEKPESGLRITHVRIYNHNRFPMRVHFFRTAYSGYTETSSLVYETGATTLVTTDSFSNTYDPPLAMSTVDVNPQESAVFNFDGLVEVSELTPDDPRPAWATGARITGLGNRENCPRWPDPSLFVYDDAPADPPAGYPIGGNYSKVCRKRMVRSLTWFALVEKLPAP